VSLGGRYGLPGEPEAQSKGEPDHFARLTLALRFGLAGLSARRCYNDR
jgi:hypothetical protein